VILGHGVDVFFFLSQRSFFGREGGKNKEESKIVNDSYLEDMLTIVSDPANFGDSVSICPRNC
jgi:hypothetical protein